VRTITDAWTWWQREKLSTWRKLPHWHNVHHTHHSEVICLTCPHTWDTLHNSLNLSITHNLLDVADITYSAVLVWSNTWCLGDTGFESCPKGIYQWLHNCPEFLTQIFIQHLKTQLNPFVIPYLYSYYHTILNEWIIQQATVKQQPTIYCAIKQWI